MDNLTTPIAPVCKDKCFKWPTVSNDESMVLAYVECHNENVFYNYNSKYKKLSKECSNLKLN